MPVHPERKHQHIARRRYKGATEHDDPVNRFLARIEQVCRWMLLAEAATLPYPLDVKTVREVPAKSTSGRSR
jgi:hypothetical protein